MFASERNPSGRLVSIRKLRVAAEARLGYRTGHQPIGKGDMERRSVIDSLYTSSMNTNSRAQSLMALTQSYNGFGEERRRNVKTIGECSSTLTLIKNTW